MSVYVRLAGNAGESWGKMEDMEDMEVYFATFYKYKKYIILFKGKYLFPFVCRKLENNPPYPPQKRRSWKLSQLTSEYSL